MTIQPLQKVKTIVNANKKPVAAMPSTTFGRMPNLSYFTFTNHSEEPKSPELLNNNIWQKCSARKIRKFGEQKKSIIGFAKSTTSVTPVYLVGEDLLDELILAPVCDKVLGSLSINQI